MYVAMLLTDWYVIPVLFRENYMLNGMLPCRNIVKNAVGQDNSEQDVYIGRSEVAMWMRVVSGWICMVLYMWSLLAPALMPDR